MSSNSSGSGFAKSGSSVPSLSAGFDLEIITTALSLLIVSPYFKERVEGTVHL